MRLFDSTAFAFDAQKVGAINASVFDNQTVKKSMGKVYDMSELRSLAKHIEGGIKVRNRN